MSEKKRGRLSKEEELIISQNLDLKSDEEIAAMINREAAVVAKVRASAIVTHSNESLVDIIDQLKRKFFWKETLSQLLDYDEEVYFQQYWANLVQQFASSGILTTDELMMRDLIILDILLNRSNHAKRNATKELRDVEAQMEAIYEGYYDDPIQRVVLLEPLQNRANGLRGAMKALSEEYKLLQDKKDKKYDQLRATRQLRLEKTEKAGHSFFDLVKMLDSPEYREREGRMNDLYKVCAEVARMRFEQYHKYENGKLDRPFLTPEAEERANVDQQTTT